MKTQQQLNAISQRVFSTNPHHQVRVGGATADDLAENQPVADTFDCSLSFPNPVAR
jgi:hypothetical protein